VSDLAFFVEESAVFAWLDSKTKKYILRIILQRAGKDNKKDPTVWLDKARPANTRILPSFPRSAATQHTHHQNISPNLTTSLVDWAMFYWPIHSMLKISLLYIQQWKIGEW